jgi:hypothetical protein
MWLSLGMTCGVSEMSDFSANVEAILRQWEEGKLGAGEFRFRLFQTLSPATLENFLEMVQTDVVGELITEANTAQKTEEQWSRMRVYPEQDKESIRRYRVGVETLRQWVRENE